MKKICSVDVCGYKYTVFSADPSRVLGMSETDEGYCRTEDCKIFLNKDLHHSRVPEVLLHELIHAIFDASGICYLFQLYLPDQHEAQGIMEEMMIRVLTPALRTTLRQVPKLIK